MLVLEALNNQFKTDLWLNNHFLLVCKQLVHHPIKTAIYNGMCPVDVGVDCYLIGFLISVCWSWHQDESPPVVIVRKQAKDAQKAPGFGWKTWEESCELESWRGGWGRPINGELRLNCHLWIIIMSEQWLIKSLILVKKTWAWSSSWFHISFLSL